MTLSPAAMATLAAGREVLASTHKRDAAPEKRAGRSKRFYSSLPWRRARYAVLADNAARNGGTARCELCGTTAAPGAPLNVDHIEALSKNWERRLDKTNLQVLCGPCNHGKLASPPRDFRPPPANAMG